MRQQGDSQAGFRTALNHQRSPPSITKIDWQLLISRAACNNTKLVADFSNALRIYTTINSMQEYNSQALLGLLLNSPNNLEKIPAPILQVKAVGTGQGHEQGSYRDIGLESMLLLAIGARVMLLDNLWSQKGLDNRSLGIVNQIIWAPGIFYFFLPILFFILLTLTLQIKFHALTLPVWFALLLIIIQALNYIKMQATSRWYLFSLL
jgi:hypothetical protein